MRNFAKLIVPLADYVAQQALPQTGTWLSSAYACDPAFNPTDELVRISIVSNSDFTPVNGQTIAAGQALAAFFDVGSVHGVSSESLSSYNEQLPQPAYDRRIVLALNTPPNEPQSHQFTIYYQLANGRELRATTDPVVIS